MYPWATYRKKKGVFKLHTLLDHSGHVPSFMVVTDGKTHDVNAVKDSSYCFPGLTPDSILLVDRAYYVVAYGSIVISNIETTLISTLSMV